jgi:hypothetical protein
MKSKLEYIFLVILIILLVTFYYWQKINRTEVTYVESPLDNKLYLVRNIHDKKKAAYILSKIKANLMKLRQYVYDHQNEYPEMKLYINRLYQRLINAIFSESSPYSKYTSYTVDKGEEIVLCLRSKTTNNFHNMNVLMYVALHEISHIASPEKDHVEPFPTIFKFHLEIAIKIGIWRYENYSSNPCEYCGTTIREHLLDH